MFTSATSGTVSFYSGLSTNGGFDNSEAPEKKLDDTVPASVYWGLSAQKHLSPKQVGQDHRSPTPRSRRPSASKKITTPLPQPDWREKVFIAQMDVTPGQPKKNAEKILALIEQAKAQGSEVVIFSEMCVSGYLIGDDWEQDALVEDILYWQEKINEASLGITVIYGGLDVEDDSINEDGRMRKYNAAFVVRNGQIQKIYKTNMPKYRMFDDERHFYSAVKYTREKGMTMDDYFMPIEIEIAGQVRKFGVVLCEDMWSDDYIDNPIKKLVDNGAQTIINLSCSPWTTRKNDKRHRVVHSRLKEVGNKVDFIYVNNTGIQDNGKNIFLFDGASTYYDASGKIVTAPEAFWEGVRALIGGTDKIREFELNEENDYRELMDSLVYAFRKFMEQFPPDKKVLVGLSGGRDSTLVAYIAAKAIGADRVIGVNLPAEVNGPTAKGIAYDFAKNLGIKYGSFPIQEILDVRERQLHKFSVTDLNTGEELKPDFSNPDHVDLGLQNEAARERGAGELSLLSHFYNAIYTNNGNKTEVATGYATLYGDVNGGIAVIADVYKTQVNKLLSYINKWEDREIIPPKLFETKPSAELSKSHSIEEGKGDPFYFDYHDYLLRGFIEERKRPVDMLRSYIMGTLDHDLGIPEGTVKGYYPTLAEFTADLERIWNLLCLNFFKRIQAPPIITVSRRSFGFDLREHQIGRRYYETAFNFLKAITQINPDEAALRKLIGKARKPKQYEMVLAGMTTN